MFIKIVKGNVTQKFHCEHFSKTNIPNEEVAKQFAATIGGIVLNLVPGPTLKVPEDGDVVFVENDSGDTIDCYRFRNIGDVLEEQGAKIKKMMDEAEEGAL